MRWSASVVCHPTPANKRHKTMTLDNLTPPASGALILQRLPEVKARCGLSRSEIYRRVSMGDFPAPVKLGERASAWPEHEVSAWIASRIAARDAKAVR
jgi:prophage regulatory protein